MCTCDLTKFSGSDFYALCVLVTNENASLPPPILLLLLLAKLNSDDNIHTLTVLVLIRKYFICHAQP